MQVTNLMMMMMVVMATTLVVRVTSQTTPVQCQSLPSVSSRERLATLTAEWVAENSPEKFHQIFVADSGLAKTGHYKQLCVTDAEVTAACKAVNASALIKAGKGGAYAPHPRTCFAYLFCVGRMLNFLKLNTVYYFNVYVIQNNRGVYYNPVDHIGHIWGMDNNCAVDPCKTNKDIALGWLCNMYVTCEIDPATGNKQHVEKTCPAGQGFDPFQAICVPDPTCGIAIGSPTENIRCYATGPHKNLNPVPGMPDEAYYNRTFKYTTTGVVETSQEVCSAGMVFDPNDKNSTELCRCVLAKIGPCKNVTLILAGASTTQPWEQIINSHQYNVPVDNTQGPRHGWAVFQRDRDFNYYDAQGLAENELSGNWSLQFRFALNHSNPSSFVLCENSHDVNACPDPSIRISVASQSLRAEVILKFGRARVSVQLNNVNPGFQEGIAIVLQREGDILSFSAKKDSSPNSVTKSVPGMGPGPLAATRCGMVFGKDFNGWLEYVKLEKDSCHGP